MRRRRSAILHAGANRPLFGDFPNTLARLTGWRVSESAKGVERGYLLAWEGTPPTCPLFIPFNAIRLALDKRAQARCFAEAGVSTPETHLFGTADALRRFADQRTDKSWVLKWPTGCGGLGHMMFEAQTPLSRLWCPPYLLQEFIPLPEPEVYRAYVVAEELFGWNVRRFPAGQTRSPWVAGVTGAIYMDAGVPPPEALHEAREALAAAGLLTSFGCADLLCAPDGRWLALEVNTDGLTNYVLRPTGLAGLEAEMEERLAAALSEWDLPNACEVC